MSPSKGQFTTIDEYIAMFEANGLKFVKQADLTSFLAKTYESIVNYIKQNPEIIKQKFQDAGMSYLEQAMPKQFGFPESQRLAEERKLGCVAMVFEKAA